MLPRHHHNSTMILNVAVSATSPKNIHPNITTDLILLEKKSKSMVTFNTVSIREYDRILGDHPDCTEGPPITIGWKYAEQPTQELDDYESNRNQRTSYHLTSASRKTLMKQVLGISDFEIRKAQNGVRQILRQRQLSKSQTKTEERVELILQSARRKLKRIFTKQ